MWTRVVEILVVHERINDCVLNFLLDKRKKTDSLFQLSAVLNPIRETSQLCHFKCWTEMLYKLAAVQELNLLAN